MMVCGKIVKTGGPDLAFDIEKHGYVVCNKDE
jgi:Fe-S cluster assembly ATPase SufC